jgi:acetyltransferase
MDTAFEPFELTRRGTRIRVREILPSDEEEIVQGFERLSPGSRYMRFMTAKSSLDIPRLRALLASFPASGQSIVATIPAADGIDIIGTASYVTDSGTTRCEFGIAVADAWSGAGLGCLLMRTLIDMARRRGLREMHGYVLAENRAMLQLARRLGFSVEPDPGDYSVRLCRLRLA